MRAAAIRCCPLPGNSRQQRKRSHTNLTHLPVAQRAALAMEATQRKLEQKAQDAPVKIPLIKHCPHAASAATQSRLTQQITPPIN